MTALLIALLGLAACVRATDTPQPPVSESGLHRAVREMLANQAAGRLGSVEGIGLITSGPVTVLLANGEVSLFPRSPEVQVALATIHRRWVEGGRQPLAMRELQDAFLVLTAQRLAVKQLGGESLTRFAKTDDKGQYRFEQVPEGRWLLVANLSSTVSALLWAIPIDVAAGAVSETSLADANILLEGRVEKAEVGPAP